MRPPEFVSPIRVFLVVISVVFTVECVIMLGLLAAEPFSKDSVLPAVLDSVVLVCVLCPVLWLVVVRPLRALVAERGALLSRTMRLQEEERARLARDLHDELGQAQTAILLGLRSVMNAPSLEAARDHAGGLHEMALSAVDASRRMARGLSPSVLTDFGLARAIERVCEDLAAATGLQIERTLDAGPTRLDPAVEIAAYRVVQEALTNAAKHAAANHITVTLSVDGGHLNLTVADDGRGLAARADADGPQPSGQGLGVKGMRERVVLLGGRFSLAQNPSGGTTLSATIPTRAATP